ncbi:MAG: hypothetical protein K2N44_18345 [Lachnospiraceae bacterium]|nr:hypothetical protein [Lachnospiraceae bacterium]
MTFNSGKGRYMVELENKGMAAICRKKDMTTEKIDAIHRMLLDNFNNDRKFYTHTQSYDNFQFSDGSEADEGSSPLLKKFADKLGVLQPDICEWGRLDWVEDIDTLEIAVWLKSQSEQNIELLTLIIVDGFKQCEIAELWGCSDTAISKRMKNIRNSLLEVLPTKLKERYGK